MEWQEDTSACETVEASEAPTRVTAALGEAKAVSELNWRVKPYSCLVTVR